jgi:tight adherence protein B
VTTLVSALAALGLVLMFGGMTSPPTRRRNRVLARLDELASSSGVRGATGPRLVAAICGTWFLALVPVAGLTRSLVVAVALASVVCVIPLSVVVRRVRGRRGSLRQAWPDAISTLIASVRAGVSLPEACLGLVERGPREIRPGFSAFASSYRASGSFRAGLERLRDEMADPVADRVVAALSLAQEVGGTDLVRVLRTLADFVREDVRVRREIEARWSWTLTAARLAAAAPWIVLGLMATRSDVARAYGSTTGILVILGGSVATLVGYRLMLHAARLPEERRLS